MNKIKPKLIDYNFVDLPKKKISEIQNKIVNTDNTKFYINLFMILILSVGAYILYNRMKNKENIINENRANILFLNEYVNNSLENNIVILKNQKRQIENNLKVLRSKEIQLLSKNRIEKIAIEELGMYSPSPESLVVIIE